LNLHTTREEPPKKKSPFFKGKKKTTTKFNQKINAMDTSIDGSPESNG
jgi:hypothetical protein